MQGTFALTGRAHCQRQVVKLTFCYGCLLWSGLLQIVGFSVVKMRRKIAKLEAMYPECCFTIPIPDSPSSLHPDCVIPPGNRQAFNNHWIFTKHLILTQQTIYIFYSQSVIIVWHHHHHSYFFYLMSSIHCEIVCLLRRPLP